MQPVIKIGTRESELAVWQATLVQDMLQGFGYASALVYIKSEGDIDLKTPLYEMGVQGIFTHSLDVALLNNRIDIAVHSMKDVPTQLPAGIAQAAVLKRGNFKDLFVVNTANKIQSSEVQNEVLSQAEKTGSENEYYNSSPGQNKSFLQSLSSGSTMSVDEQQMRPVIATSSIRRKAQWLHRYPESVIDNIRGNINTRLAKVWASKWHGAVFAAAGLERINKKPAGAIELDWMLPAPAQGAIMVAARIDDAYCLQASHYLNDTDTVLCTKAERDFLRDLLGGCSTPVSALAQVHGNDVYFQGSILSLNGREKLSVEKTCGLQEAAQLGKNMATQILASGGEIIMEGIRNGK